MEENNELRNRTMRIGSLSVNNAKTDIEAAKADIENKMRTFALKISHKTLRHIWALYDICGTEKVFGRSAVEDITGLRSTRASDLIKSMLGAGIIRAVAGKGKGKYRFCR